MSNISSDFKVVLLVLGILGALLLLFSSPLTQGFTNPSGPRACGVDMPPCAVGTKCINGWCRKAKPEPVYDPNPVELLSDPNEVQYADVQG